MKRLFVVIKTTGLDPKFHALVEVSTLVDISGVIEGNLKLNIKPSPGKIIDTESLMRDNWSEADLNQFGVSHLQLQNWKNFLSEYLVSSDPEDRFILVGYNAPFVRSFLQEWFEDHHDDSFFSFFKQNFLDLQLISKQFCDQNGIHLLDFKKTTVLQAFHIHGQYDEPMQLYKLHEQFQYKNTISSTYLELDDLNASQKESVQYHEGPLLVLAGAGSGKTRVITYKIAYLIFSLGYSPDTILAVTFTNKAAREMKERLQQILGQTIVKRVTVTTFHSLGLQILKEEYPHLGYAEKYSIFADSEKEALLKEVLFELRYSEEEYTIPFLKSWISSKKNLLQRSYEIQEKQTPLQDIYKLYEEKLKLNNAFDFDDLIFQPLILFMTQADVKQKWSYQYRFILVDEYQDTNYAQYQLMKVLSAGYSQICAVGDDDQSIYAFRGADIGNILAFSKDFDNARSIILNYNYRNTPSILRAAMALVDHNQGRYSKVVLPARQESDDQRIFVYEAEDIYDEAQWIAGEIFSNRIDRGISYSHQAILCRTNSQMRVIEKTLREENIPYHIIGGFSFFDRVEVKILFAYLRLLHNPQDNQAFYRTINFPKRGIGEKTLKILETYAQDHQISLLKACAFGSQIQGLGTKSIAALQHFSDTYWDLCKNIETISLSEIVQKVWIEFGITDELHRVYKEESAPRINSLLDIQMDILKKEKRYAYQEKEADSEDIYSLSNYLQETILSQLKEDELKTEEQKILLITIHASKGLEFQAVFIPGLQEGGFPHEKTLRSNSDQAIEEERRLAYVALTRAKDYLFLSCAKHGRTRGIDKEQKISRFIEEIPPSFLSFVEQTSDTGVNETKYLEEMRKILQIEE